MDFLIQAATGAGIFLLIIMAAAIKTHIDIKYKNDKE